MTIGIGGYLPQQAGGNAITVDRLLALSVSLPSGMAAASRRLQRRN